jgi:hypothetical protein
VERGHKTASSSCRRSIAASRMINYGASCGQTNISLAIRAEPHLLI